MDDDRQHVHEVQFRSGMQRLDAAVCGVLRAKTTALRAGFLAAGLSTLSAQAVPFPPVFPFASLWPVRGGDGSSGFVIAGLQAGGTNAVRDAGDVNGDGIEDIVIGAGSADTLTGEGQAYVVFGSAQGFGPLFPINDLFGAQGGDGSAGFVLGGIDPVDATGRWVSGAGDFNGDGFADVLVGAPFADPAGNDYAGESYIVFGRAQFDPALSLAGLLPAGGGDGRRGIVLPGIQPLDKSGWLLSRAGDLNADGVDDVIIGALCAGPDGVGDSYVIFGSQDAFEPVIPLAGLLPAGGGDGSRGFAIRGIDPDDCAGIVAAAGDVNGDGVDDVVIGADNADPGGRDSAGEVYVVFGRREGFAPLFELAGLLPENGGDGSAGFVLEGISVSTGYAVDGAGDVNGDGIDDVVIGAPFASPRGIDDAGEAFVVFGRDGCFPATISLASLLPTQGGDGSRGFVVHCVDRDGWGGLSVSAAGDVNGDGVEDLLIGAPLAYVQGVFESGEGYVIFGRIDGFDPLISVASLFPAGGGDGSRGFVLSGGPEDHAGSRVSGAGDVNADGVDDLIVSANFGGVGGVAYVVYGRAGDTRR
jgi:glycosylphosphatidylinositol phospholipase D